MWERSFVATSVLTGASADDALGALDEGGAALLGDLPDKLRDPRRAVRAHALALVAQEVVAALDVVKLR